MFHRSRTRRGVVKSTLVVAGGALALIGLMACVENVPENPTASSDVPIRQESVMIAPTADRKGIPFSNRAPAEIATLEPGFITTAVNANDGFIPANVTLSPFDVHQPAVGNLNPDLLAALQHATSDAATDGVEIRVNSGWRSRQYQQQLLNEAEVEYGSAREARKWVSTPDESAHVAGNAVDIAPIDADDWLMQHGSQYGLCQIYANEIWHFELAVQPGTQCPQPRPDASDG